MSQDINLQSKTPSSFDDLVTKAARFGAFGWIAFFITLFFLIAQNFFWMIRPQPTLATVDGQVVGQVVFDEARTRANDQVIADLKMWVRGCTSTNKNTIYEDLSVCLSHMDSVLAEQRVAEYEKTSYAKKIQLYGCANTTLTFDDAGTQLSRDPLSLGVAASLKGEVECIEAGKPPTHQGFSVNVKALLVGRTNKAPLAIRVQEFWDSEE